ncbi:MAG: glucose-1-phosphate cytidylyltransferase [Oligoflexia bacterium]|nr:glucose-1-phosphate cytidylyltransferase [Oligoflexia bacterium]
MKVAILAGGYGTRLSEETTVKPKPMVEIGCKPILWHIMKHYSFFGFNEFVVLLGYKGYSIKEYFANYYIHQSDVTIDTANSSMQIHNNKSEKWKITLVDTGIDSGTGARIKCARKYIGEETFMLTYGDGLCDVNLRKLYEFHLTHKKIATLTSVLPAGRYGALEFKNDNSISHFCEKKMGDGNWINGGYFVLDSKIYDYIRDDDNSIFFEREPLERLASEGELVGMKHEGFWRCMDTLRDKTQLCDLWDKNEAPWKLWRDEELIVENGTKGKEYVGYA